MSIIRINDGWIISTWTWSLGSWRGKLIPLPPIIGAWWRGPNLPSERNGEQKEWWLHMASILHSLKPYHHYHVQTANLREKLCGGSHNGPKNRPSAKNLSSIVNVKSYLAYYDKDTNDKSWWQFFGPSLAWNKNYSRCSLHLKTLHLRENCGRHFRRVWNLKKVISFSWKYQVIHSLISVTTCLEFIQKKVMCHLNHFMRYIIDS